MCVAQRVCWECWVFGAQLVLVVVAGLCCGWVGYAGDLSVWGVGF